MVRYFFDERDNGELQTDLVGREFVSLEAAIAHARQRFAGRFEGPTENGHERAFRVEIRNEDRALPAFILDASSASGQGAI
jgi:hypothetical protein